MSLCEKFKKPKIRSAAKPVLCVFEYIFKMQADLTISFIFEKCASDYCFRKGSLKIDDHFIVSYDIDSSLANKRKSLAD